MEENDYLIALLEEVTLKLEELQQRIEKQKEEGEDTAEAAADYFRAQQVIESEAIVLHGFNTGEIADSVINRSVWIN